MKYLLWAMSLSLLSCGGSDAPPIIEVANPTPSPSPTPTPMPLSQALVGNWISLAGNHLDFSQDGSVKSADHTLTWSVDSTNKILFSSGPIEIDTCSYQILSSGGLTSNLIIVLSLA